MTNLEKYTEVFAESLNISKEETAGLVYQGIDTKEV